MATVSSERVLVVPTALFHRLGYFQGFTDQMERYLGELFRPQNVSFRPRSEVETDPGFKQLIPYVIFRYQAAGQEPVVFQYTRGKGQGESRLHSKRSVGIGGHISDADVAAGSGNPYEEGMRREVDEEVLVNTPYRARCVGLINDDLTEVGRVHLGVVHIFDVERPDVQPRESDIMECGFRPVRDILADTSQFETWSEICMQALFGP